MAYQKFDGTELQPADLDDNPNELQLAAIMRFCCHVCQVTVPVFNKLAAAAGMIKKGWRVRRTERPFGEVQSWEVTDARNQF